MRQQGSHHRLYAMVVVISFMMLVCDGCRCQRFTFDQFKCDCYQSGDGCSGSGGCTYDPWVCDGSNDCGDWSDEKYCLNTKLYCRNDECVKKWQVNDGTVDMTGGYDEFYVVRHRVISVDAFQVMTIVPHLESAFPTFGSVTQEMTA